MLTWKHWGQGLLVRLRVTMTRDIKWILLLKVNSNRTLSSLESWVTLETIDLRLLMARFMSKETHQDLSCTRSTNIRESSPKTNLWLASTSTKEKSRANTWKTWSPSAVSSSEPASRASERPRPLWVQTIRTCQWLDPEQSTTCQQVRRLLEEVGGRQPAQPTPECEGCQSKKRSEGMSWRFRWYARTRRNCLIHRSNCNHSNSDQVAALWSARLARFQPTFKESVLTRNTCKTWAVFCKLNQKQGSSWSIAYHRTWNRSSKTWKTKDTIVSSNGRLTSRLTASWNKSSLPTRKESGSQYPTLTSEPTQTAVTSTASNHSPISDSKMKAFTKHLKMARNKCLKTKKDLIE